MNCRKFQEQISLHLDGKLSSAQVAELMKHIDNCSDCKQFYNDLAKIKKILSAPKPKINISPNFTDSIMQSIYKLPAKKNDNNIVYINIRKYFMMAASFIFVLFASIFFVTQQPKSNLNSPIFDSESIFEAYDHQIDNIYENDVTAFLSTY